jgi:uncharacterized membrane protein YkgB
MLKLLDTFSPNLAFARLFMVVAIAVTFGWLGLMNLQGAAKSVTDAWIAGHPFLSGLSPSIKSLLPLSLGGVQIAIVAAIALYAVPSRFKQHAYTAILVLSVASLSLLATNPVWIAKLGGFPAIGSGQGILKYLAIAGAALWLMGNRHAQTVMILGLILVLGWIGGMKFTAIEADGIYPLVTSSPFFTPLIPAYLDKMQMSYVIGVFELITVFLLTAWWWKKPLAQLGLWASVATFVVTLSFMVTFNGAWAGGFPLLTSAGQFLLKDLMLLAVAFALMAENKSHS